MKNIGNLSFYHQNERGFAIGPILLAIMLMGVAGGVIFSGNMQILQSNIRVSNSLATKNAAQNAASTLAKLSVLGTDGQTLCPPRTSDSLSGVCDNAPVILLKPTEADLSRLPINYTIAGDKNGNFEAAVLGVGTGLPALDAWGRYYIVCRWENLRSNVAAPSTTILSSGADGILQTSCGDAAVKMDDKAEKLPVAVAVNQSSLWQATGTDSLSYGSTGTRTVVGADGSITAMNLVGDTASFSRLIANTATINNLVLSSPLPVASGGTGAGNSSDAHENLDGILNASACGKAAPPSWCSGADIGAWLNAAFLKLKSSPSFVKTVIVDSNSSYNLTTTIVKPAEVLIDFQYSTIKVTNTSLLAAIVSGSINANPPINEAGIKHLVLIGPDGSSSGTTYGIYEGSDPAGVISPTNLYSAIQKFEDVDLRNFKAGYSHGSNAWSTVLNNVKIFNNYDGIYVPSGLENSGENMQIVNSVIGGNRNCGININYIASEVWTMYGGSVDYNDGPNVCGEKMVIFFYGAHIEDSKAPLFLITGTSSRTQISSFGSVYIVTGEGGPYDGYFQSAYTGNVFKFNNDIFYRKPTIKYLVYTGGAASVNLMASGLLNKPPLTDAGTINLNEQTPFAIRYNFSTAQSVPSLQLERKASTSYTVNELMRLYNNWTSGAANQPAILFTNNSVDSDPLTTTSSTWALAGDVVSNRFYLYGKFGGNSLITPLTVNSSGFLGLNATSPQAGLDDNYGKFLVRGGTAPTISSCGTGSSVAGSDSSFVLTMGAVSLTSCVVSFGTTWLTAPKVCSLTPMNAIAAQESTTGAYVSTISTTQLTIAGLALMSAKYGVHCF